jgi:hypothetical protein
MAIGVLWCNQPLRTAGFGAQSPMAAFSQLSPRPSAQDWQ